MPSGGEKIVLTFYFGTLCISTLIFVFFNIIYAFIGEVFFFIQKKPDFANKGIPYKLRVNQVNAIGSSCLLPRR